MRSCLHSWWTAKGIDDVPRIHSGKSDDEGPKSHLPALSLSTAVPEMLYELPRWMGDG